MKWSRVGAGVANLTRRFAKNGKMHGKATARGALTLPCFVMLIALYQCRLNPGWSMDLWKAMAFRE